ncbi:TonB-dependent receptor [Limibacter armeniacum]|uniref:SusC/RagA family TonB-linked outer membrane protein n=1 Tax=Limibacter armeniacum TaxID=466084 RepID=UPI002FE691D7
MKQILILLLTLLLPLSLWAQERIISGTITDENGQSMPGVSVLVKGTTKGTVTDLNGKFSLNVNASDKLVISYIGYMTVEQDVSNKTKLDLSMAVNDELLDEIVVVGYGVQKKSHLTGAVAKIKNEGLADIPVSRVDQALYGQLAGLQIQNTNGEAGSSPYIQVRGMSTINAGKGPLIVVDGYPIPDDLSGIDMNDVASIEVLKDAASAAIYGSRGANGVIMITTKSGGKDKMDISFRSNVGMKTPALSIDLYSPQSWLEYVATKSNVSDKDQARLDAMEQLGTATDWQDATMRAGKTQNYQLSVSGSSGKTNYYVSGSYFSEQGIMLADNYEKFAMRVKLQTKLSDRLEMGFNINPSFTNNDRINVGIHDVLRNSPWLPVWHTAETAELTGKTEGELAMENDFRDVYGQSLSNTSNVNGYAKLTGREKNEQKLRGFFNTNLKLNLMEGMDFKTSIGVYATQRDRTTYQNSWAHRNGQAATEASYNGQRVIDMLNENILTYSKEFGNHSIDALAGFTYQKTQIKESEVEANNFLTDKIKTLNAGTIIGGETSGSEHVLMSYLSRASYAYKGKYLLSASIRWDGSSRFGPANKYGFFPSVSAGWRVTEENFMAGIKPLVSDLKLRVSYGATGNNGIPNYGYLANIGPSNYVLGDDAIVSGYKQTNLGNPSLSWERTFEFDAGFDLGLFNDRFIMGFDYYDATSDQLLLELPIPSVTGFTSLWVNQGKVKNTGIELELTTVNIQKADFSWSSSLTFATTRNELLEFGGDDVLIQTVDPKRPNDFITRVGEPIVQFYGYKMKSELSEEEMNVYWPIGVESLSVYVEDLDGDGKITEADKVPLGKPFPDFTWGITNNVRYKNLDLSFTFQGSEGASVFNLDPYYYETQWKGDDNALDLPAETRDQVALKSLTDYHVQDASYIALRNLTIGYNIPVNKFIRKARVYFSGSNLIYLAADNYTSLNPEGINQYTDSPLLYGYQRGANPLAKTYSAGITLDF